MDNPKRLTFTVPGEPAGKGRPKFTTRGPYPRAVTPAKTVNYETLVKLEYSSQCGGLFFDRESALALTITAYKAIPKSTSKRKAQQMMDGELHPCKKPDYDNIGKIISDALNGIAYHDDAQIVDGRVIKAYGEPPRVEVELKEIGHGG